LQEIIRIFDTKIGVEFKKEELESIIKEGEERYKNEIPPGFKDIEKKNNEKYSDLITWKSIIEFARQKTNIVLVLDDKKEDWWYIVNGKTVGPLPRLIKEFESETNRKILIYRSEQFYEYG
jgi:hypothetical protein